MIRMLDLSRLDLDEIANALSDQTDYEHRWLTNPDTGEVVFWTSDTGIDGKTPVDLDELDELYIDPLPSYVWYQDMADFAERISDERAGRRLTRAIQGKDAFAGSKTSYTWSSRTCCQSGMPSATPEPDAARSNGWPTTRSSMTARPPSTSPSTPSQTFPRKPSCSGSTFPRPTAQSQDMLDRCSRPAHHARTARQGDQPGLDLTGHR